MGKCKYNIVRNGDIKHLCDDSCFQVFRANPTTYLRGEKKTNAGAGSQGKTCDKCKGPISATDVAKFSTKGGRTTKNFCQLTCLVDFQKQDCIGKQCSFCKGIIQPNCAVVAQVEEGGQQKMKPFCSEECLKSNKPPYEDSGDVEIVGLTQGPNLGSANCSVCHKVAPVKHEVTFNQRKHKLCGDPCFAAFRYANKLTMNTCDNCGTFCTPDGPPSLSLQFEGKPKRFCKAACVNLFKSKKNKIVPCGWCGVKKNIFEMVERMDASNKCQLFCTLNCLSLYRVNLQATSNQSIKCDQCKKAAPAQYHLTMSDASVRNFCSYNCVMAFQGQFTGGQKSGSKQATPTQQQRNTAHPSAKQQAAQQSSTNMRQSSRG